MGRATGSTHTATPTAPRRRPAAGHDFREHLPLRIDSYPADLRADVELALSTVLALTPAPAPAPRTALYEQLDEPWELPASAPAMFGLCGKPHAGKDVVADYLQAHYGHVARMAFSDTILDEVNPYLARYAYRGGRHVICEANKSEPHYRHLLQAWGMARRAEDVEHWTKQVAAKVRGRAASGELALNIVTGARMPSDVDVVAALGGRMWRVVRPGNTYEAAHAVEAGLDHLPDSAFITVYNPVENALGPYEANIEAVLRDKPQPFGPGTLQARPTRAASVLAFLDGAFAVIDD